MKTLFPKRLARISCTALFLFHAASTHAADLTSIPGPDDQGGMVMPMVSLSGTSLNLSFAPASTPRLYSLEFWSPGDTFLNTSAWNNLLDPVDGQGALFNNQYGFMFMANPMMGMDFVPSGKALGIRLLSRSSNLLEAWNYVNNQNRFDEVFANPGDQVLWNGTMWHNYFTLPDTAPSGIYTASFEVFIADLAFTAGTGFADYTPAAMAASQNMGYETVTVNYSWQAVPEPSSAVLLLAGAALFHTLRKRHSA